jgi:hypothetical protein
MLTLKWILKSKGINSDNNNHPLVGLGLGDDWEEKKKYLQQIMSQVDQVVSNCFSSHLTIGDCIMNQIQQVSSNVSLNNQRDSL